MYVWHAPSRSDKNKNEHWSHMNQNFTLQAQSDVGEPGITVVIIWNKIYLDFHFNIGNQVLKKEMTLNWLKIHENATISLNYKENEGWNNP